MVSINVEKVLSFHIEIFNFSCKLLKMVPLLLVLEPDLMGKKLDGMTEDFS